MSVRQSDGFIALIGHCDSEDAGILLQHLVDRADVIVDWSECDAAHTAVIQLLLFGRPTLRGEPRGELLRRWIAPLLTPRHGSAAIV